MPHFTGVAEHKIYQLKEELVLPETTSPNMSLSSSNVVQVSSTVSCRRAAYKETHLNQCKESWGNVHD